MEGLKRCRHCGGRARVIKLTDTDNSESYKVMCKNCGISTLSTASREQAEATWNRDDCSIYNEKDIGHKFVVGVHSPGWKDSVVVDNDVDHPDIYNKKNMECIDFLKYALLDCNGIEGFCIGNAIKLLWRWKCKGGKRDLKKAFFYISWILDHTDCDKEESE